MSTESSPVVSLSVCRAALIDAAARAIPTFIRGDLMRYEAVELAEEVVDAVLPLIADAIEDRIGFGEMSQHMFGLSDAARVVRSFAEETS